MVRLTTATAAALGVLTLITMVSLHLERRDPAAPQPLINPGNGLPVTLESLQRELEWRRETVEKLRRLN
jgi:hypothetical protein